MQYNNNHQFVIFFLFTLLLLIRTRREIPLVHFGEVKVNCWEADSELRLYEEWGLLILSMVKSIADIIPDIDVLRFSVINGIGMLLFIGSLYIGRLTTDSKKIWFYNGFTAAGLILIIYSSAMEIQGAMHEFAIPVVHILEVFLVLWVANKMIKYDEQEKLRFIELSHFPSTVDGSIWLCTEFYSEINHGRTA